MHVICAPLQLNYSHGRVCIADIAANNSREWYEMGETKTGTTIDRNSIVARNYRPQSTALVVTMTKFPFVACHREYFEDYKVDWL